MKHILAVLSVTILVTSIFAASAYGVLSSNKTVTSAGRISTVNVGVYKDSACIQPAASIDWGNLTASTTVNYTLYIKNTGSARETLSLATNSWSPSTASQYLTILWDKNGAALNANAVTQATLTLTVSASIDTSITSFTNNIVITGTM